MISNTEKRPNGSRNRQLHLSRLLFLGLAFLLVGCIGRSATQILSPAPNLYTFETGQTYPAEAVPIQLRETTTEIFYVTDRNPMGSGEDPSRYGDERSDSMAFGASLIEYGNMTSWEELIDQTQSQKRQAQTKIDIKAIDEITRFPATPLPFQAGGGRLQTTEAANAAYSSSASQMRAALSQKLRVYGVDRVLVYVHGFNIEFDDAVNTLASLWHYSGRRSLPIAFSWPAGNQGPLAYFRDIESGEFSIFHAKEFLRILVSVTELDRIDIVAHSRGSAVMTTALRELLIEARAAGQVPRKAMKTGVLVLAAADIDVGVARQRLVAERFVDAFEQINIYTNPNDEALRLSRIIGKVTRLGGLDPRALGMAALNDVRERKHVGVINVEGRGAEIGHAYFRENPAVLSDIVLTLRTRSLPGSLFRPLEEISPGFFSLHQNYPAEKLPEVLDRPSVDR